MPEDVTILVTGGTGKLGRRLVAHFLASEARVVFTARREETRDALIGEHEGLAGRGWLVGLAIDLMEIGSPEVLVAELDSRGLKPRALINNARSRDTLAAGPDGRIDRDLWLREMTLNVVAAHDLTLALADQENGALQRVVNVASMYGIVAANPHLYDDADTPLPAHYGVVKAALIHLTKELAVRLAPRGIAVNAVSYGGVEGRASEAFAARYASLSPAGRMLKEDEVAGPVDFLVSGAAAGMTGHNLVVDGGWSIW